MKSLCRHHDLVDQSVVLYEMNFYDLRLNEASLGQIHDGKSRLGNGQPGLNAG